MDQVPTTQPIAFHVEEKSFISSYWWTFVLLPVILVVIVLLNYFNILPLSSKLPKIFSFLPHKEIIQKTVSPKRVNATFIFTLSCPLAKNLCATGKDLNQGTAFSGIIFNIPEGTPILSAFDGKVVEHPKVVERSDTQPLIYIRSVDNHTAIYSYYGITSVKIGDQVKSGAQIGTISKGSFPVAPLIDNNFLFSLRNLKGYQKITIADFVNSK